MTTTIADHPRRAQGGLPLASVALAAPLLLLVGLASGTWLVPVVLVVAFASAAASLRDARAAFLVLVLLCTFVDYTTGLLTLEMAIVCAWVAWMALLLYWRSAWSGWVLPPRAMLPGLAVWLGACAMGVVIGIARGNPLRNLGLEIAAALWPLLAIAMMQVFRRRHAAYAMIGFFAIGLVHTAFGLAMLQIAHRRLGGIYFTTVTGLIAVVLWSAALLAPHRRVRWICLAGMIPMLAHLLFSFTRGYWLGAIAGLLAATALAWSSLGHTDPGVRGRRLARSAAALGGVAAITLALSIAYFGGGRLVEAIGGRFGSSFSTEVSGETMSNVIRLAEYDRAIGAALRSPVFGHGLGYAFVTREPLTGTISEQWFVHNYYILLWLKLGIVGLAAFAFLVGSFCRTALRTLIRDDSWLARASAVSAIAVTAQLLALLLTNYSLADLNTASAFACVWGFFWTTQADR